MNALFLTSQIVCYGVSIVSASLNIARFVRGRRATSQRMFRSLADFSLRRLESLRPAGFQLREPTHAEHMTRRFATQRRMAARSRDHRQGRAAP
jgi:hypothetical protein